MSKASPSQKRIQDLFSTRPVLYVPGLAIVFGVNEAILISQLLYWRGKGHRPDQSFYKTHEELYLETGLTRDKQDRAIKKFKQLGVLTTKNKGVPQKRHFYIDVDKLAIVITELLKTDKSRGLKLAAGNAVFQQTITEIRQKTTAKSTSKNTLVATSHNPHSTESLADLVNRHVLDIYDME